MATGDIGGNIERLKRELRQVRFTVEVDEVGLRLGDPVHLLPVLHHVLLTFSRYVAGEISAQGYELKGKTDRRFVECAFKVLRDLFGLSPVLTPAQFLDQGYAERKVLLLHDIVQACNKRHNQLARKSKLTKQMKVEAVPRNQKLHVPEVKVVPGSGRNATDSGAIDMPPSHPDPRRSFFPLDSETVVRQQEDYCTSPEPEMANGNWEESALLSGPGVISSNTTNTSQSFCRQNFVHPEDESLSFGELNPDFVNFSQEVEAGCEQVHYCPGIEMSNDLGSSSIFCDFEPHEIVGADLCAGNEDQQLSFNPSCVQNGSQELGRGVNCDGVDKEEHEPIARDWSQLRQAYQSQRRPRDVEVCRHADGNENGSLAGMVGLYSDGAAMPDSGARGSFELWKVVEQLQEELRCTREELVMVKDELRETKEELTKSRLEHTTSHETIEANLTILEGRVKFVEGLVNTKPGHMCGNEDGRSTERAPPDPDSKIVDVGACGRTTPTATQEAATTELSSRPSHSFHPSWTGSAEMENSTNLTGKLNSSFAKFTISKSSGSPKGRAKSHQEWVDAGNEVEQNKGANDSLTSPIDTNELIARLAKRNQEAQCFLKRNLIGS